MTCLFCFRLLSARFLIEYCFVSHDNLQIKHVFVLGVTPPPPPIQQDFWFTIGVPQTFFRADSVSLNTPYTSEKSDKIIFRTTQIIGTCLGLSEGGKSAWLSSGVYPALGTLNWISFYTCILYNGNYFMLMRQAVKVWYAEWHLYTVIFFTV